MKYCDNCNGPLTPDPMRAFMQCWRCGKRWSKYAWLVWRKKREEAECKARKVFVS